MKKVILTTLALVLAVSTVLSVTGFALAQNERVPGEEAVAVRMGLVIRAPLVAKAGEPLRIQIVTRPGERPVPDAEVWAVNIDNNPSDVVLTADVASLSGSVPPMTGVILTRRPGYGKRVNIYS